MINESSVVINAGKNGKITHLPSVFEPWNAEKLFPAHIFSLSEDFASFVDKRTPFKIMETEDLHGTLYDEKVMSDKEICGQIKDWNTGAVNFGTHFPNYESIIWRASVLGRAQPGNGKGDLLRYGLPNIIGYTSFHDEYVSVTMHARLFTTKNDTGENVDVWLWHCAMNPFAIWHHVKIFL